MKFEGKTMGRMSESAEQVSLLRFHFLVSNPVLGFNKPKEKGSTVINLLTINHCQPVSTNSTTIGHQEDIRNIKLLCPS